ncbi:ATP-binding protein [Palleronia aestuarii]|nr:ATP-binding protein [Palleronia aestuarii]
MTYGNDAVRAKVRRGRRDRLVTVNRSTLTRKIVFVNILAILLLVAGVLILDPARRELDAELRTARLVEADLSARLIGEMLAASGSPRDALRERAAELLDADWIAPGQVSLFDAEGELLAARAPDATPPDRGIDLVTRFDWLFGEPDAPDLAAAARAALVGGPSAAMGEELAAVHGAIAAPIDAGGETIGVLALVADRAGMDRILWSGREHLLRMFLVAVFVSAMLSMFLASTIARPLEKLASAAEIGRHRNSDPGVEKSDRVRLPDLSARSDEIGRLSGALGGMVSALYDRIETNERFAADVAHEIKNPLASLSSAVGSLRFVKTDEQRERLLEVIDHDVQRLDRLVSDISNASRLDSELVREEEEPFDLLRTLTNIAEYLGREAEEKGIEFITDLPTEPIVIEGLESRLAQVFVNLLTNAISFCENGDAIRLWARRRANRILVVVEDTGPGIPPSALQRIFDRFYSERPEGQFGNNSGLGLAISKQIVEAHGGVIWAENIEPTEADPTSEPLGARLVVGLPV